MKSSISFILFLFGFSQLVALADESSELGLKRERISRQLAEFGYQKWIEVQQEYIAQLARTKKADFLAQEHRQKSLVLIRQYGSLQEIQQDSVELMARKDLEQAQNLAMEFVEKNLKLENELDEARQKQQLLDELAKKHQGLLEKLTMAEQELRQKIENNRKDVDQLVTQLQITEARLKELNEKSSKNTK
jgi:hypothetical protein